MKNLAAILIVLSFALFSLYLIGCDSEPDNENHGDVSSGKAQTTCPVMGGKIDKKVYADYNGKRVYFCCAGCDATFKKDPEKYIKELEEAGVKLEPTPEK